VHRTSVKTRPFSVVPQLSVMLLVAGLFASQGALAQQSIAENLRPVGKVCMAGQPCVGSPAAGASPAVAATTPEPEVAATTPEPEVAATTPEPEVAAFDAATVYQQSCFACHGTGAAGAPEIGDPDAWSERMEKGMDAVMANVITGINAMPPKGLCMSCSDDDLKALVNYMVSQ